MMKKLMALILALLFCLPLAAQAENEYIPNCVDLYLPSNPSTGYVWVWRVEDGDCVAVTEQFFADAAEPVATGVGGTHWFHFDGLSEGVASVVLTHGRPWEETPLCELVFRVSVDAQLNVMIWGVEAKGI